MNHSNHNEVPVVLNELLLRLHYLGHGELEVKQLVLLGNRLSALLQSKHNEILDTTCYQRQTFHGAIEGLSLQDPN